MESNKNYYTSQIPLPLAEKLKEKGMPDIEIVWNPIRGKHYCFKTYAEVFDWLMEKGIIMEQTRLFGLFHIRPIQFY